MLKSILNIKDVQQLDKKAQKSINGGIKFPIGCQTKVDCYFIDRASQCVNNICVFL